MEVKIVINKKEYTIEEAKQLYDELCKLFKDKEYLPYAPYPVYPETPAVPTTPYYTTCSEGAVK